MKLPELEQYEASLKVFRDNKAVFDYAVNTAFDEGEIKGRMEGKIEIARQAKIMGLPVVDIVRLTGLSEDQIQEL